MTTDIDKERADFERLMAGSLDLAKISGSDNYLYNETRDRFKGWCAKARAAIPPSTAPRMTPAMRSIGATMSNIMFNLGQHATRTFSDYDACTFRDLAKQWDAARSADTATPQTAPSQVKNTALQALVDQAQELDMGYGKAVECAICDGTGTAFGKVCDCRGAEPDGGAAPGEAG